MKRTRLQPRQIQLAQPAADRAYRNLHRKPARHLGAQINAAPTYYLINIRVRPIQNKFQQLRHLCLIQQRHRAKPNLGN